MADDQRDVLDFFEQAVIIRRAGKGVDVIERHGSAVFLAAPAAKMDPRLRTRRHDASDTCAEVLARRLRQDPRTADWLGIDANTSAADWPVRCPTC